MKCGSVKGKREATPMRLMIASTLLIAFMVLMLGLALVVGRMML